MQLVCKITGELIYCYQVPDDGAVVGISVGVSLAIVLVAALVVGVVWKKKQNSVSVVSLQKVTNNSFNHILCTTLIILVEGGGGLLHQHSCGGGGGDEGDHESSHGEVDQSDE